MIVALYGELLMLICVSQCVSSFPTMQNTDIWNDNNTTKDAEFFESFNIIGDNAGSKNVSDLSRMPRGMFT